MEERINEKNENQKYANFIIDYLTENGLKPAEVLEVLSCTLTHALCCTGNKRLSLKVLDGMKVAVKALFKEKNAPQA